MRRTLKTPRIGHTGTLDPLATGVLPLVIGRATRLAFFLTASDKEYIAAIRLGLATETYDAAGRESVPQPPAGISTADVEDALDAFRGTFEQAPPPYSAKKVDGVRAYTLARTLNPTQPAPATVTVHDLALERYADGLAVVRIRASAGFYVRSLAHDLGRTLGCGAHLETLRRVRAGSFTEEAAVSLSRIHEAGGGATQFIVPLEQLLPEMPAVVLTGRGLKRAVHGNDLASEDGTPMEGTIPPRCRLFDAAGHLVGIAEARAGGLLHPVVVLV